MGEHKEEARHFDNETNTWYFDCEHDASNTSTYESCGPWPENKLPATTQAWLAVGETVILMTPPFHPY